METTVCVTIVDKTADSEWRFWEFSPEGEISRKARATGSRFNVLRYSNGKNIHALRGLSPGTQKVFTLTESQRIYYGLGAEDVVPCVTTLRHLPQGSETLNRASFNKHYRDQGKKCWLVQSHSTELSPQLRQYLDSIPQENRKTATCLKQDPWFKYKPFPVLPILVGSGFTSVGPKIVVNKVGAHHVGSVYGVFCDDRYVEGVVNFLRRYNFEKRVISHSGNLKKVEVRQLNTVLEEATSSLVDEI